MNTTLLPILVLVAATQFLASCGHVHHLPRQHRAAVVEPHLTIRIGEERRALSDTLPSKLTSPLSPSVQLPPQYFLRVSDPSILELDSNRRGGAIVKGLRPGIADVLYRDDNKLTRIRVEDAPAKPAR